jgi:hypothetical protein
MIGEANECLFKLMEPLIKFLEKVLPPVFGANWKNIIFEELKRNPKRNYDEIIRHNDIRKFGELDMAMLIAAILILATIIVDDPQDSCRAWRSAGARHVIARREAPKQSRKGIFCAGLLRFARNDGRFYETISSHLF